ncbi:MAG: response regulator [Candidatus Gastranaerophilales bacterium]|nr:response regulator [Candidatus Gastranaerophilales bacterium]
MYKILVVDDEPDNLQLVKRTLRRQYDIVTANNADEAIEYLKNDSSVEMVISDHRMPGKSGVELLHHCFEHYPNIIRMLITAYSEVPILVDAINTGKIHKYIKKPWTPEELLLTVDKAFETSNLSRENVKLINDFKDLFTGTISAISDALDEKDKYTCGRSKRVCEYAIEIAKEMNLTDMELSKIEVASLLHDIGMIGVPEYILHKTDKLTDEEYLTIKNHVEYSLKILGSIKQLDAVVNIIKCHHERYDGSGYPYGMRGEEIPIGARIIALADTFDALISSRAYRNSKTIDEALEIIKAQAGKQLDYNVVQAFLRIVNKFDFDNIEVEE